MDDDLGTLRGVKRLLGEHGYDTVLFQSNGLPAGVTFLAPAFHDPLIAAVAAAFQAQSGLRPGAGRGS